MTPHDLIAAFETVAEAPSGVVRLRELVVELAVRGRLVPQDPNDEPASALLERIAGERARLLVEGTIRSSKRLPRPTTDRMPFCVPEGWSWVRLAEVAWPQAGFAFKSVHFNEARIGMPLIRIRDIDNPTTEAHYDGEFRPEFVVKTGDVLVGMDGNFNARTWQGPNALLNQRVSRLIFYGHTEPSFVAHALQERLHEFQGVKAYTTVQHLSGGQISEALIPLPPLAEQHRIVARVDELLGLLDRLEAARSSREATRASARNSTLASLRQAGTPEEVEVGWNRFAERMGELVINPADIAPLRQTVLELAMRGRLVPQVPSDEPASLLLERIAAERARHVRTGAGRRQATSPLMPEKMALSDLPGGWSWSTAQALTRPGCDITYGILKPVWVDSGVPTVRVTEMKSGVIDVGALRRCDPQREAKFSKTRLTEGDLLISKDGTIGKTAFVPAALAGGNITQHVLRFSISQALDRQFVRMAVDAPLCQDWMTGETKGVALQGVNVNDFRRMPLPVPPLAEQHRIVARVDELMSLLEQLEARLSEAQRTHAAFAAAAVHHLDA